jgi:formylglycine-generating enzyme required for sulfatase activity
MPGKIFVNYRRDDERAFAARIRDRLAQVFGASNVFMDVDNLLAGQRFDKELERALGECDVFIAVIGPRWVELLRSRAKGDERDYVREEIAAALQRGIIVIPVLIERTPLPRSSQLPADIQEMVLHQKHDITHEHFGRDVEALIAAIRVVRRSLKGEVREDGGPPALRISAVAAIGLSLVAGAVAWQLDLLPRGRRNDVIVPTIATPPAPPSSPKRKDPASAITLTRCSGIEITVGQNERRCFEPGAGKREHFKDCPTCPEMVVVPAGTFTMGSPPSEPERSNDEAQVRVSIAEPFAVGRFAVTFDEWDACVAGGGCNGYKPAEQGWGRGERPVINVNWDDAKAYAAWLSRKTGKTYRLLSEAEREYVTRASTTTPFWWGSSITPKQANYDGNYTYEGGSKGEYRQRTVPVDSFEPNPWGLYNVHGNVWEWTEDCWNDSNIGNPGDGRARSTGITCTQRMVRGGSWNWVASGLRSAVRLRWLAVDRDYVRGFRLARTSNP